MSRSETIMVLVSVKYIVKNKEIPHLNFALGNNVPNGCTVRHVPLFYGYLEHDQRTKDLFFFFFNFWISESVEKNYNANAC